MIRYKNIYITCGEVKERERGKYNKNAEKCGEMVWIHGGVGGDRMVEMNIPNGCR